MINNTFFFLLLLGFLVTWLIANTIVSSIALTTANSRTKEGPTGASYTGSQGPPGTGSTDGVLLAGDVVGPINSNTVALVGGQSASSVANAASAVASATSFSTPSTLVVRDTNGSFSANQVTANQFNGNY